MQEESDRCYFCGATENLGSSSHHEIHEYSWEDGCDMVMYPVTCADCEYS